MKYDYLKKKLKTILPFRANKFLSILYNFIQAGRFFWLYYKLSRIVKKTPFNPAAVFPSDFNFNNSGICRLVACRQNEKYPSPIAIVEITSWLTKKALKEMRLFAKNGGKFISIPTHSGIPTKYQAKLCSLIGYTTEKPFNYLKGPVSVPLGMTDFLPIGRFNPETLKKEYDFLIVTWARDIYHKRWDIVLKLIIELCPKYKMLVVAYKGEPSRKDMGIINKHEASGGLKFINQWIPKNEFPKFMQKCKVLIMPSEKDNQPRILDQALLFNIPIVVNQNIYGGKKLVSEQTGKLVLPKNLSKTAEWVLKNMAGKIETRLWYLKNFGTYNATRLLTNSINKIFKTDYRLVCGEGNEFKFTADYINSISGLPEDYKDLIVENPDKKVYKIKVSVIMSVFNGQQFLKESIESILSQSFNDFEFIIIDDGSTDRTPEIFKNYAKKDPRIKIITNEKNIGLTKSLNKAIRVAQGEYIARQDADDLSLPQRLEKQIEFLDKHIEIKILGTFGFAMNKEGKILRKEILPVSPEKIKRTLIKKNPFFHTSVMIKKEILEKLGGYNEDFVVIQDYELWFRILRIFKGENLPLFLIKKRYQPKMISFKKNKEQIRRTIFLKKDIIKKGDYSKFCYIYLLRSYLSLRCPLFLKIFLKNRSVS